MIHRIVSDIGKEDATDGPSSLAIVEMMRYHTSGLEINHRDLVASGGAGPRQAEAPPGIRGEDDRATEGEGNPKRQPGC